jgi:hypothetical protein
VKPISRFKSTGIVFASIGVILATGIVGTEVGASSTVTNVQVSHRNFAYAEPSIAVNPRNPKVLLAAAMFLSGSKVEAGTFWSRDSGRSWVDNGPLTNAAGAIWSGDVTAAFDRFGNGYVSELIQTRSGDRIEVWRSANNGSSLVNPTIVAQQTFQDRPSLAVSSGGSLNHVELFEAWRTRQGLDFSRSVDGGRHFSTPREIVKNDQIYLTVVASGPNGMVAISYEVISNGANGPQSNLFVVLSHDGGDHFDRPIRLGSMIDQITLSSGVVIPTDVSIAINQRSGALYVAFETKKLAKPEIEFTEQSTSQSNWTTPRPIVLSTMTHAIAFQPRIVVDAAGSIDVTSDVLNNGRVSVYLARSLNLGQTFGTPIRVSARFNPSLGIISQTKGKGVSSWWIGDYQSLASGGRFIYPCWSDTRSGRLQIFVGMIAVRS